MKNIWIPFAISTLAVILIFITAENLETVFTNLLHQVAQSKLRYSWVSFFILSADIVLPVPSSIVMFLNGFILGKLWGATLSLGALLVGSVVGYYLGLFTSYGLKTTQNQKAAIMLEKYGHMAIVITRGIPILAESICIVCGYNKMPLKQYFLYNLIGYFPICFLYAICGSLGYDKDIFFISFGCSLIISFIFWYIGKRFFVLTPKANNV